MGPSFSGTSCGHSLGWRFVRVRNPSLLGEDFHRLKRPGGCGGGEAFFCHRHYILSCYSSLWDREAKKQ
ncbi:hypothetical protein Peur_060174 [Populus x canadensis]